LLLVVVGDFKDVFHTHVAQIQSAIALAGLKDRVLLTGFVPDGELVYLYSRAYALVQPSLMEGFGLPAVEAMACGTPVISSRAGSLPEVVGDAGLFFDPTDVASMAATICQVLDDSRLRDDLACRALDRASRFTWDRAAGSLLECFSDLDSGSSENLVSVANALP
jgi:glycosyltransferase involved in cell wall biosynthesis